MKHLSAVCTRKTSQVPVPSNKVPVSRVTSNQSFVTGDWFFITGSYVELISCSLREGGLVYSVWKNTIPYCLKLLNCNTIWCMTVVPPGECDYYYISGIVPQ